MSKSIPKWTEERVATLVEVVGQPGAEVPAEKVVKAAEQLSTSTRSIASKLRNMDYKVASMSAEEVKTFSDAETGAVKKFLEANPKRYTSAEVAEKVCDGKFNARQIQGKALSMDLVGLLKPTPKAEVIKKFTEEETAQLLKMLKAEDFIEDIAEKMGKEVRSIRGKALSMRRNDETIKMPKQKEYKSKNIEDPIEALGEKIATMTVKDIHEATDKTERGVRQILTHRGLTCADYDGAARKSKIDQKAAEANAA